MIVTLKYSVNTNVISEGIVIRMNNVDATQAILENFVKKI